MKVFFHVKNIFRNIVGCNHKIYNLVERQDFIPLTNFSKDFSVDIPQNADSFSYVKLAKIQDENSTKEVLTFFDRKKRPISRNFFKNGCFDKRQFISYFVHSRKTLTEKFVSLGENLWNTKEPLGSWETVKTKEMHILSFDYYKGKLFSVTSKETSPVQGFDCPSSKYNLIRYPDVIKTSRKSKKEGKKQFLSAIVHSRYNEVDLSDIQCSKNLNLDMEDKFLPYRILNPRTPSGMIALTKYYIRQKGLEKLEIPIFTSYTDNAKSSAFFAPAKGHISYNLSMLRFYNPEATVNTIAHEVEHAWQHSLAGRAGFVIGPFANRARIVLGKLTNPDQIKASKKYAAAIKHYPDMRGTSTKDPIYYNNLLEIDARNAGKAAEFDYKNSPNYELFLNVFRNASFQN